MLSHLKKECYLVPEKIFTSRFHTKRYNEKLKKLFTLHLRKEKDNDKLEIVLVKRPRARTFITLPFVAPDLFRSRSLSSVLFSARRL